VITGPEGATREIELCDRHAAAVANAFALGRPASPPAQGRPRRTTRTTVTPATKARTNGTTPQAAPPEPEPIWR
jgi:hypothetical protein